MMINENTLVFCKTKYGAIELKETYTAEGRPFSLRLYLDNGLQWDRKDEYRYHQSLFIVPLHFMKPDKKLNVLILGGGDGLGVRELLKYKELIDKITLVDISKEMIFLAKNNEFFLDLNENSLNSPKVNVIIQDGIEFVKNTQEKFDYIILDYPDPMGIEGHPLNKLFTTEHYKDISTILKDDGIISLQATSANLFPNTFRKIQLELIEAGFNILPAKIDVNSYGDIGFVIAKKTKSEFTVLNDNFKEHLFYDENSFSKFFTFFKDEYPNFLDEQLKEMDISEILDFDFHRPKNWMF